MEWTISNLPASDCLFGILHTPLWLFEYRRFPTCKLKIKINLKISKQRRSNFDLDIHNSKVVISGPIRDYSSCVLWHCKLPFLIVYLILSFLLLWPPFVFSLTLTTICLFSYSDHHLSLLLLWPPFFFSVTLTSLCLLSYSDHHLSFLLFGRLFVKRLWGKGFIYTKDE